MFVKIVRNLAGIMDNGLDCSGLGARTHKTDATDNCQTQLSVLLWGMRPSRSGGTVPFGTSAAPTQPVFVVTSATPSLITFTWNGPAPRNNEFIIGIFVDFVELAPWSAQNVQDNCDDNFTIAGTQRQFVISGYPGGFSFGIYDSFDRDNADQLYAHGVVT